MLALSVGSARTTTLRATGYFNCGTACYSPYPRPQYWYNDTALIFNPYTGPFARFLLGSIPSDASVARASVKFFVYGVRESARAVATNPQYDPNHWPPEIIYWNIKNGQVVSPECTLGVVGWSELTLNSNGGSMVEGGLVQGWCTVGFNTSTGWVNGEVGVEDTMYAPILHVEYYTPGETDLQPADALLRSYPMSAGGSDTIVLHLRNRSMYMSTHCLVQVYLNGCPFASFALDSVRANATTTVVLPVTTPENPSTFGTFSVVAFDSLDLTHSNDTASFQTWIYPAGAYYAASFDEASFPPSDWRAYDLDAGRSRWGSLTLATNSGPRAAGCYAESDRRNDDWLLCCEVVEPVPGEADSLGFYRTCLSPSSPESLEVWALSGPLIYYDTIECLWATTSSSTNYECAMVGLDEFDGDTIHLGIRYRSLGSYGIGVDDFFLSRVPSGGIEDAAQVNRAGLPFLTPSPSRSGSVLRLPSATTDRRLTMYDATGRMVCKDRTRNRWKVPQVPAGVYVIRLESSSETGRFRLVVQH
jgi:hypothetical protein